MVDCAVTSCGGFRTFTNSLEDVHLIYDFPMSACSSLTCAVLWIHRQVKCINSTECIHSLKLVHSQQQTSVRFVLRENKSPTMHQKWAKSLFIELLLLIINTIKEFPPPIDGTCTRVIEETSSTDIVQTTYNQLKSSFVKHRQVFPIWSELRVV